MQKLLEFLTNATREEIENHETLKKYYDDVVSVVEETQTTDEQANAPNEESLPTVDTTQYKTGDYDILVLHNGEYKHPKDIENFVYNDGQYPDYPKGWISGMLDETEQPRQRNSVVEHYGRLGYVDGNGYTTIINNISVRGQLGWCGERSKDPVSYASNYNDGSTLTNTKQTYAIWVGYNDVFGIMSGAGFEYKYVVTQAVVWHFEPSLDYNARVYLDGYGDVTHK